MARVYHEVALGEDVRIEIRSGHALHGSVVWAREGHAGVKFQNLIDVKSILSDQDENVARYPSRLPRMVIRGPVRLRQGGRYFTVPLCDISPGGAQVEISGAVSTSGDVSLFLPNLPPIHGTVRWARAGRAGLAFNESLGLEPLAIWIRDQRRAVVGGKISDERTVEAN